MTNNCFLLFRLFCLFRLFRLNLWYKIKHMDAVLEKTTRKDQQMAKASLLQLQDRSQKFLRIGKDYVEIRVQDDAVKIPKKAILLLFDIIRNMADGKSVALILADAEISTQQAADMLHVSRPHVVKLLEEGAIPFKKVGAHRRITIKDLIEYEEKVKENRSKQLDFLARQAQELNLGY